jgi:hypothetical protein
VQARTKCKKRSRCGAGGSGPARSSAVKGVRRRPAVRMRAAAEAAAAGRKRRGGSVAGRCSEIGLAPRSPRGAGAGRVVGLALATCVLAPRLALSTGRSGGVHDVGGPSRPVHGGAVHWPAGARGRRGGAGQVSRWAEGAPLRRRCSPPPPGGDPPPPSGGSGGGSPPDIETCQPHIRTCGELYEASRAPGRPRSAAARLLRRSPRLASPPRVKPY